MHIKFLEQFVDTQKFFNDGYETAMSQVQKLKNELELQNKEEIILKLENQIDNLIICISNEHPNLIVGFIKNVTFNNNSDTPNLVIHDLINNKDIIPLGIVMIYTQQKFNALNRLSFNERLAIFFHQDTDEFIPIPQDILNKAEDPLLWCVKVKQVVDYWLSHKV